MKQQRFASLISFRCGGLALVLTLAIGFVAAAWSKVDEKLSAESLVESDPECRCGQRRDPLDVPVRIATGTFRGECIDSCKFRPVFDLAEDRASRRALINILHNGEYWRAEVDPEDIERAGVLFENFSTQINHVALRFIFKQGRSVPLISQSTLPGEKSRVITTNGLVISPEAAHPKGGQYDFLSGFAGEFPLVFRAFTIEHFRNYTSEAKHPLVEYDLALDSHQAKKLFRESLLASQELSYNSIYQLILNNCATVSLDLLKLAQGRGGARVLDWEDLRELRRGLPLNGPFGTRAYLKEQKLLVERATLGSPTLR